MKNNANKILAIGMAMMILSLAVVAGTFAWLKDTTETVTNVFVSGKDVVIELYESDLNGGDPIMAGGGAETGYEYALQPGQEAKKQVYVSTGPNGSAECYVFITVETPSNFDEFISVTLNTNSWQVVKTETVDGRTKTLYAYATVEEDPMDPNAEEKKVLTTFGGGDVAVTTLREAMDENETPFEEGLFQGNLVKANTNITTYDGWTSPDMVIQAYAIQTGLKTAEGVDVGNDPATVWDFSGWTLFPAP